MRASSLLISTLVGSMLIGSSLCHGAETYPDRSVRMITPFGAGGTSDFMARLISSKMTEELGQNFIVENRAGAGTTVGTAVAARAKPDGYTLILIDAGFGIAPIFKSLPYDVSKDFTLVSEIMDAPQVLVVSPSLHVDTLKAFVALARANPGKFNYGSGGVGSTVQMASELFNLSAKVDIKPIPYSAGGGAMMAGLLGDQVQMVVTGGPTAVQYVKNGSVKALAVTSANGQRMQALPDVPTMAEGGIPGAGFAEWFGVAGPAGLPRNVVDTLLVALRKSLTAPQVKAGIAAQGGEAVGSSPAEFSVFARGEVRKWADVVKAAHLPQQEQ